MVAAGITNARPRGSAVDIPRRPPEASRTGPFLRARDRQVERYTVIDPATTQAMPSRAKSANDAHPHDRPAAVGSEHQGERPKARLDCSWEIDFDGLLEAERDNIGAAIAAGDARLHHPFRPPARSRLPRFWARLAPKRPQHRRAKAFRSVAGIGCRGCQ